MPEKAKGGPDLRTLAKLRNAVKRYHKQHADQALHFINMPCMNLCPKDGVTVCNPTRDPSRLMILRSLEDIEQLHQ